MPVNHTPDGYQSVIPYIVCEDADGLLGFMADAFDAQQIERHESPDGKIMHAEARIGDSVVMLTSACEKIAASPVNLYVYLPDVDEAYRRALAAGATSTDEPKDQFYGDRSAGVRDLAGNQWWIATHIEDVSPEELARRAQQMQAQPA